MKTQGIRIERPKQEGFEKGRPAPDWRGSFGLRDYSLLTLAIVMAVLNLTVVFFAHWL